MWSLKSSSWRRLAGAFAAVLVATAASAALAPGDPLPDFSAYELSGEVPDLRGKVVLVDVWASWCAPCKASFPAFNTLQAELGPDGFVILAVSVDRKASAYAKFIERLDASFATVHDAKQSLVATLSPPAMPTSYLFGRDGRLRSVHTGFHGDSTVDELRAEITRLLKE